jgi:ferredoxin
VCPSGALSYAYPGAAHQGQVIKTLLGAYRRAGGQSAALLLHDQQAGQALVHDLGRAAALDKSVNGLPARVLPLALWHSTSVGLELWLSAIAHGASQVWVLLTGAEAPQYRDALQAQMDVAQALLSGLGYHGSHLRLLEARDARDLAELDRTLQAPPAQGVAQAATFAVQADKRATLELALDHLLAQAPAAPAQALPLPPEAPLGSVVVDAARCTLCLSCVGACPAGALLDNPDQRQLRFIEKNCVQCGLCVTTCPERALALQPRWLPTPERRTARVLHAAQPYGCVRCGKPFGTQQGVQAMLERLAGHAMFQGAALERLKMCSDCRVIDLYSASTETRIQDL